MIKKIEHLGIAVKGLKESGSLFQKLLGKQAYKNEKVAGEGVDVAFFQTGESKLELLEGTKEGNAISRFIEKKGEGIHHIAFDVDDIYEEIKRLKGEGFTFISEEPKKGADNKIICFLHPKSTNGVLIELCQEISE